jgi:hypothetical protein
MIKGRLWRPAVARKVFGGVCGDADESGYVHVRHATRRRSMIMKDGDVLHRR